MVVVVVVTSVVVSLFRPFAPGRSKIVASSVVVTSSIGWEAVLSSEAGRLEVVAAVVAAAMAAVAVAVAAVAAVVGMTSAVARSPSQIGLIRGSSAFATSSVKGDPAPSPEICGVGAAVLGVVSAVMVPSCRFGPAGYITAFGASSVGGEVSPGPGVGRVEVAAAAAVVPAVAVVAEVVVVISAVVVPSCRFFPAWLALQLPPSMRSSPSHRHTFCQQTEERTAALHSSVVEQ